VLLRGDDERRRFAAFAVDVTMRDAGNRVLVERVLPYREGRCQFLGDDDRCTIYEDRPQSCREFECAPFYNARGIGRHARFLELNPRVERLLSEL
jgi:Fe-S-cluster containining protein